LAHRFRPAISTCPRRSLAVTGWPHHTGLPCKALPKIKEEYVADTEAAAEKLFEALEPAQPDVRYASGRLSDGVTFVAFLELEPGQEHPLRTFPAYAELLEGLKQWAAEPATVEHVTVIGSYRLFWAPEPPHGRSPSPRPAMRVATAQH
jgi:hypothetical protein